MAEEMKKKDTTTIKHFKDYICSQVVKDEDDKEYEIVYIPPEGFLQGVQELGINLSDLEIK